MKSKLSISILSSLAAILLLTAAARVDAQADDWKVLSSTTDSAGTLTIVEQAADGRTRTTTRRFFRSKPDTVESENFVTKDPAGNKTSTIYSRWNWDRRQIAWGEEFYDARGYTFKGKRWRYEEENGRVIEPRINEEFNPRTKKWERIVEAEVVRVMFVPARRDDAKKAGDLLRTKGFAVELREVAESEQYGSPHEGQLYYQLDGSKATASSIAEVVKEIERLTVSAGAATGDNPPDYSLWITRKKEVGHRFQGVFRNRLGHLYGIRINGDQVKIATAKQVGDPNNFVWADDRSNNFRPSQTKLTQRGMDTTVWSACGDPDTGSISAGIDRPAMLIFGDNAWSFEIVIRDGECLDGRPHVGNGWIKLNAIPMFGEKFYKVSDTPPSEEN